MSKRQISLRCPHHPDELQYLKGLAGSATSILEIGSRYGDTLAEMARAMPVKGKVLAVDLPGIQPWGYPDSAEHLCRNIATLREEGYQATVIFGDSTDPEIVELARGWAPFDLVFIDGDHRYEGVKKDWENYGPMGKIVVFHDIVVHPASAHNRPEVYRLFEEIQGNKSQFIGEKSLMGLGIVIR